MLLRKRRVPVNAIPKDPGIVHPKDHAFSDSDYRRLADVKSESSLAKNDYRVACFLHYMADVLSVLHPDSFAEEVLWILCGSYHHASTSITILPFLSPRSVSFMLLPLQRWWTKIQALSMRSFETC
jgi:hypothetical protein